MEIVSYQFQCYPGTFLLFLQMITLLEKPTKIISFLRHFCIIILALSYVSDVHMHAGCNNPLPTSHGVEDLCSKINLRRPGFVCGPYLCSAGLSACDSNYMSNREVTSAVGQGKQMTVFQ
jgi:hypothetical protein